MSVQPATENGLDALAVNVTKAKDSFLLATLSLRGCYGSGASSVPQFVELRKSATNEAMVYKQKILPLCEVVVGNFVQVFDYYSLLKYKDWCDILQDMVTECQGYAEQAQYLGEVHNHIMTCFKKQQDKVKEVLATLKLEEQRLETQAAELRASAEKDTNLCFWLSFVPYVNVIAVPILNNMAKKTVAKAVSCEGEAQLAVVGAKLIEGSLVQALELFVDAMSQIAGFFNVLKFEIEHYATSAEAALEEKKMSHYKLLQAKAEYIKKCCRLFIANMPDAKTNLDCIPADFDQNYVQKWLESQLKDDAKTNFLEWGKALFQKNKEVKSILDN